MAASNKVDHALYFQRKIDSGLRKKDLGTVLIQNLTELRDFKF